MRRHARYLNTLLGAAIWLGSSMLLGQQVAAQPPFPANPVAVPGGIPVRQSTPSGPVLTTFNLEFPGGTPVRLVEAIQKAMGRKLNAIVPEDAAEVRIPELKMEQVNVSQLFQALRAASVNREAVRIGGRMQSGPGSVQIIETGYSFEPGSRGEPLTDNTIWYFSVMGPPQSQPDTPTKSCRFYSLAPYLERQLKVDDITTAIETAWKMLGDSSVPTMKFHQDTKLLIAVGEPDKLETIEAVLRALEPPREPATSIRLAVPKPQE